MKKHRSMACFCWLLPIVTAFVLNLYSQPTVSGDSIPEALKMVYSIGDDLAKDPLKAPDTSSPRATLRSFLGNVNRTYRIMMAAQAENLKSSGPFTPESVKYMEVSTEILFERSVYCLDLSQVPEAFKMNVGYIKALQLKEILDRIDLPAFTTIPDAEAIEQEAETKKYPRLFKWQVPNTNIIIGRIEDGPREGEYLITAQTVARMGEYYVEVKDLPYKSSKFISKGFLEFYLTNPGKFIPPKWAQWLPKWSKNLFFSQTIWQWIVMVILLTLAFYLMKVLYHRLFKRTTYISEAGRIWRKAAFVFSSILIFIILTVIFDSYIKNTGSVLLILKAALTPVFWILMSALVFFIGRAVAENIIESPKIDPEGLQASYLRALFSVLGFILGAVIFIYGLSRVGVSLLPLLTGVGIGGLAIALAARPTIENIIASFMIFADDPYKVGQRVKVMGHDGTVESIGLRSTRIRLLTGPLTIIPNEKMASSEIENIGRRPYIRRTFSITITYDTPVEKIDRAIAILKEILAVPEVPKINGSDADGDNSEMNTSMAARPQPNEAINKPGYPPRVYFDDLNSDSLNILVNYWFHPPEYWDYLEHAHGINLKIMERFKAEGIEFAFPTQTLHLAGVEKHPIAIDAKDRFKSP